VRGRPKGGLFFGNHPNWEILRGMSKNHWEVIEITGKDATAIIIEYLGAADFR
jgi:hypothetical protein